MADIQHSAITDPHVHEPKGASTAANNTVYVADGVGSGTWQIVGVDQIDYDEFHTAIQQGLDDGDLEVTGHYTVTAVIDDISTAGSVIIPVISDSTVTRASVVLGGAITDADASITFSNSVGASMGSPVTVAFSSSAKGDQYGFTATGNNTLIGPSWIEVATNGASTGTQSLYITVEFETLLND